MKTLIFLMIIIYLIFSRLGRTAGNRNRPFPGQPKETDFPPAPIETSSRSGEDDVPLSGPWSRNGGGFRQPEPTGDQPLENGTVVMEKPRPQRNRETIKCEPEPELYKMPQPINVQEREKARRRESKLPVCEQGDFVPGTGQGRGRRKRRGHPLRAALYSKPDLASSILLGELIGPRGGKGGRRK